MQERRAKALQLRIAGATYEQIATQLGYAARGNALKDVDVGLKAITKEPAEKLRKIENQRLEVMQIALWTRASKGEIAAQDACLRIMKRRADMNGLDAKSKIELSGSLSVDVATLSNEQLERLCDGEDPEKVLGLKSGPKAPSPG